MVKIMEPENPLLQNGEKKSISPASAASIHRGLAALLQSRNQLEMPVTLSSGAVS